MGAVVVGTGCATPLGHSPEELFRRLLAGEEGFRPLTRFDTTAYRHTKGGEIQDLPIGPEEDPAFIFLEKALQDAALSAGIADGISSSPKTALILGTNFGFQRLQKKVFDALLTPATAGTASGQLLLTQETIAPLAARFGIGGIRQIVCLSCSSGAAAIGLGSLMIETGRAERVFCGGFDALDPFCWSGLSALHTMTTDTVRPFDKDRAGTLFGEGAGILVLEAEPFAKKRGATVQARVLGCGLTNDAFHLTQPPPDIRGYLLAMEIALKTAGISPEQVDHINCHGTGTPHNDRSETKAFRTLFGARAEKIPITANKGALGHLQGAAGAVEAIVAIETLRQGILPKTLHHQTPDPECDLDYCLDNNRPGNYKIVLSTSAGFGGNNSALVLGKEG